LYYGITLGLAAFDGHRRRNQLKPDVVKNRWKRYLLRDRLMRAS
jgi:hypothetical protein